MDPIPAAPAPDQTAISAQWERTPNQRPRGVVILAGLYVAFAGLFAVASLATFRPSLLLTALMAALAGWGLATRKTWAWYLAFILEGFSIILGLVNFPLGLVGVAIAAAIIWYLLTPRVRSWFARRETNA